MIVWSHDGWDDICGFNFGLRHFRLKGIKLIDCDFQILIVHQLTFEVTESMRGIPWRPMCSTRGGTRSSWPGKSCLHTLSIVECSSVIFFLTIILPLGLTDTHQLNLQTGLILIYNLADLVKSEMIRRRNSLTSMVLKPEHLTKGWVAQATGFKSWWSQWLMPTGIIQNLIKSVKCYLWSICSEWLTPVGFEPGRDSATGSL